MEPMEKIAEDATAKIEKLNNDLKSANANVDATIKTITTYHEKASTILNLIMELQDTISEGASGAEVEGTIEVMMDRSINNLLGLRQNKTTRNTNYVPVMHSSPVNEQLRDCVAKTREPPLSASSFELSTSTTKVPSSPPKKRPAITPDPLPLPTFDLGTLSQIDRNAAANIHKRGRVSYDGYGNPIMVDLSDISSPDLGFLGGQSFTYTQSAQQAQKRKASELEDNNSQHSTCQKY